MIEQYELRRNETQITIRDPFTYFFTLSSSYKVIGIKDL